MKSILSTLSAMLILTICIAQDTLDYYLECIPCAPSNQNAYLKYGDSSISAFVGNFTETDCMDNLKGILLLSDGVIVDPEQPDIPFIYDQDFQISDFVKYDGKYIASGTIGIQLITAWEDLPGLNIEVRNTNFLPDKIDLEVDTALNLLYWGSGEIQSVNGITTNKSFGYYNGTSAHLIDVPFSEEYGFFSLCVIDAGIVWLQPDGGSAQIYEYNYYTDTVTLVENPFSLSPPYITQMFTNFQDSSTYLTASNYLINEHEIVRFKDGVWSEPIEDWFTTNIFQGPNGLVFVTGCLDYFCNYKFGTMEFPYAYPAELKNTSVGQLTHGIFNSGAYFLFGEFEDDLGVCGNFGKLVDTIYTATFPEYLLDEIRIYPNPTNESINIEMSETIQNNIFEIGIYNEGGLIIRTYNNGISIIDLNFLNNGLYFIVFKTQYNVHTLPIAIMR